MICAAPAERERGAIITSEMEVFMELCPARCSALPAVMARPPPHTLIARSGAGRLYGPSRAISVPHPLLDRIDTIQPDDMVVLELSSFQLMSMRKSPDVALVTNIHRIISMSIATIRNT